MLEFILSGSQCLLGPLAIVDVGVAPEPLDHSAGAIAHWFALEKEPAVLAIEAA